MEYRLLRKLEEIFRGVKYRHRDSSQGDAVAVCLYEDLLSVGISQHYVDNVRDQRSVVNNQNKRRGVIARRGDGTFGDLVPNSKPLYSPEFRVPRGLIATVQIGIEVKILFKAMIKQIDRVNTVLKNQVSEFSVGGGQPISVAIVGVNHADHCTGYEGERSYRTDGRSNKHPKDEAPEAIARLTANAKNAYDEFIFLKFKATNEPPYPFEWVNRPEIELDYGAALARISRNYDKRFR